MEIKDLAGLSQPLTKLLEVISSGMGALYRPVGIRREAAAAADAIRLLGNAQQDVDTNRMLAIASSEAAKRFVLAEASLQIEDRAQTRFEHRQLQKQINLEAIAAAAVEHLSDTVSDEEVDGDWKTRFFNIAEDVSNAEMQDLWGKILAGEVARPGTYSIRTLEALRNLSKTEAEVFQKIRYLALDGGQILKINGETSFVSFGINFQDILNLREAGLLADGDMLCIQPPISDAQGWFVLAYNGKLLLIEPNDKTLKNFTMSMIALTRVGVELMGLIDAKPDIEYLHAVAASYKATASFSLGLPNHPRNSFVTLEATQS
jgi:hypothetical protein